MGEDQMCVDGIPWSDAPWSQAPDAGPNECAPQPVAPVQPPLQCEVAMSLPPEPNECALPPTVDTSEPFSGLYDDGPPMSTADDTQSRDPGPAPVVRPARPQARPEPIDIAAIDGDDGGFGIMQGMLHTGEIDDFSCGTEMVDRVLERAGDHPIGTLDIIDHGSPGSQQLGDERLTVEALADPEVRANLERLRGHFAEGGHIDLGGCRVARGEEGEALLRQLARTVDVPVRGGISSQRVMPGYEGSVMTCNPPVVDEHGTESQLCTIEGHPIGDAMSDAADDTLHGLRDLVR